MSRDANGNYTLPAGNPVVSGSLITSSWANDTMPDLGLEITGSLSREGKGAMVAPLKIVDDSGATPGVAFNDEPTSGLRREAAGDVRLAALGTDIFRTNPDTKGPEGWDESQSAFVSLLPAYFYVDNYTVAGVDDTATVQAAAAALQAHGGGTLVFAPRLYVLFTDTTGVLANFSDLVSVACLGYGTTLQVSLSKVITASEGTFFLFSNCGLVKVDGFTTDGPTLDVSTTTVKGYEFVTCVKGCKNVSMPVNRVVNMLAGFISKKAAVDPDSDRTQNIHIGVLDIVNCWYGVNGQYSGDYTVVDLLRTNGVHRSFFFYGASHLKANIISKDHKSTDIPITTLGGLAVTDVDINYYSGEDSNDCGVSAKKVLIGFSDQTASVMRGIKINLNVSYAASGNTGGAALSIEKLNSAGSPDLLDRGHQMENLQIGGVITGTASYNSGGSIVTDTGAVWGTGDFFSNISLENLKIKGVNEQSQVNLVLANCVDQILLKNVVSNYAIRIQESNMAFGLAPNAPIIKLDNVQCSNRWEIDIASSAQPMDIYRGSGAPSSIPVGWSTKTIGNDGIGGNAIYNLPDATPGLSYTIARTAAFLVDVVPDGTNVIRGGTAGQTLRMSEDGNQVALECLVAGFWEVATSQGNYTFV